MKYLELKVPPVLLLFIVMGLMSLVSRLFPIWHFEFPYQTILSFDLISLGAIVAIMAVVNCKDANTTVNPMNPDKSSALVAQGAFRFSRNPMYLGMVLALLGFAVYLGTVAAISLLPVFIAYMTQFQIKPEERYLTEKFGNKYLHYVEQVRRWI